MQLESSNEAKRLVTVMNEARLNMLRVMYGFKKPKFEFPIKRAHIDFWLVGFRRCFRGPAEINPQPPRKIVMAW
jgi:hypothetical protein